MRKFFQKFLLLLVWGKNRREKLKTIFLLKKAKRKSGNEVILIYPDGYKENIFYVEGLDLKFHGKNSRVEIFMPFSFADAHIDISNNSVVRLGFNGKIHDVHIDCRDNVILNIGTEFTWAGGALHIFSDTNVEIGEDCMFSYNVELWTNDFHTLFDIFTHKVMNESVKGIKIGNHVWLGRGVSVLKDVEIADNVTVGACSLVNKSIKESNVIVAGVPAKIVKKGVNWKREYTSSFPDGYVA